MANFNFHRLIIFILPVLFLVSSFTVHPYHVGSVEFRYNERSKVFEITGKFFMDDLENALNKKYNKNLHFLDKKFEKEMNETLKEYALEVTKLKVNNQQIKLNFVGFEEDRESVNLFLESEKVVGPKKVEVGVGFIYNLYDDQMNIIHIIVGGNRQSDKLVYPDRYLYKRF